MELEKEISIELQEELMKLADLEFEYNIIDKFAEDDGQRIIALGKWKRQLAKVRKLEEEEAEREQKSKEQVNGLEEQKQALQDVSGMNKE